MRGPDIIVVGVGRSGTSTIARLLQTELSVQMAYNHEYKPWNDLKGSFEEQKMIPLSYALVEIPKQKTDEWLAKYNALYKTSKFRGIKQTCLSLLRRDQWENINPRLVIRTFRPKDITVASLIKWRWNDREYWEDFYDQREGCMQTQLDHSHKFPVLRINFTAEKFSDEYLLDILTPWVDRFFDGRI